MTEKHPAGFRIVPTDAREPAVPYSGRPQAGIRGFLPGPIRGIRVLVIAAGAAAAACGGTAPPVPAGPQIAGEKPLELVMPKGWDDRVLGRVKQGLPPRHTVVLAGFTGTDKFRGKSDLVLDKLVAGVLERTGRFEVAGPEQFARALDLERSAAAEKGIKNGPETGAGVRLGAELVISGRVLLAGYVPGTGTGISPLRTEVVLRLKAVKTETGETVINEDIRATGGSMDGDPDPYRGAAAAGAGQITKRVSALFPLLGFVIQVNGPDIYMDIGRNSGLEKGDVFICFRPGERVTDPVSGEAAGWARKILGAVKVTEPGAAMSGGTVIRKSGGSEIMLGDMLIARQ